MLVASHRPGRNLTEVTVTETSVILRSEYGHLRLMEMENGILRVTFTRRDAFADTPSPYLITRPCESQSVSTRTAAFYTFTPQDCAHAFPCATAFSKHLTEQETRCFGRMDCGRWKPLTRR